MPSSRQIEPTAVFWSVVPFEAFDQPPGFGGRKGFVEAGHAGKGFQAADVGPQPLPLRGCARPDVATRALWHLAERAKLHGGVNARVRTARGVGSRLPPYREREARWTFGSPQPRSPAEASCLVPLAPSACARGCFLPSFEKSGVRGALGAARYRSRIVERDRDGRRGIKRGPGIYTHDREGGLQDWRQRICSTYSHRATSRLYTQETVSPAASANRLAPSGERVAMLGDECLDRQRRATPDRLDEIIGPRENTVGVIDGDLAQMKAQRP